MGLHGDAPKTLVKNLDLYGSVSNKPPVFKSTAETEHISHEFKRAFGGKIEAFMIARRLRARDVPEQPKRGSRINSNTRFTVDMGPDDRIAVFEDGMCRFHCMPHKRWPSFVEATRVWGEKKSQPGQVTPHHSHLPEAAHPMYHRVSPAAHGFRSEFYYQRWSDEIFNVLFSNPWISHYYEVCDKPRLMPHQKRREQEMRTETRKRQEVKRAEKARAAAPFRTEIAERPKEEQHYRIGDGFKYQITDDGLVINGELELMNLPRLMHTRKLRIMWFRYCVKKLTHDERLRCVPHARIVFDYSYREGPFEIQCATDAAIGVYSGIVAAIPNRCTERRDLAVKAGEADLGVVIHALRFRETHHCVIYCKDRDLLAITLLHAHKFKKRIFNQFNTEFNVDAKLMACLIELRGWTLEFAMLFFFLMGTDYCHKKLLTSGIGVGRVFDFVNRLCIDRFSTPPETARKLVPGPGCTPGLGPRARDTTFRFSFDATTAAEFDKYVICRLMTMRYKGMPMDASRKALEAKATARSGIRSRDVIMHEYVNYVYFNWKYWLTLQANEGSGFRNHPPTTELSVRAFKLLLACNKYPGCCSTGDTLYDQRPDTEPVARTTQMQTFVSKSRTPMKSLKLTKSQKPVKPLKSKKGSDKTVLHKRREKSTKLAHHSVPGRSTTARQIVKTGEWISVAPKRARAAARAAARSGPAKKKARIFTFDSD